MGPTHLIMPTNQQFVEFRGNEHTNFSQQGICRQFTLQSRWDPKTQHAEGSPVSHSMTCQNPTEPQGCFCETRPGEVLFIPGDRKDKQDSWWHGTCNLDAWTAGFSLNYVRDWNVDADGI